MSCWIKGENINSQSCGAGLTVWDYQSHSSSTNMNGTFDWTKVEMTFTPPTDSVIIGCRLGSYGCTITGKAWFDNLQITSSTNILSNNNYGINPEKIKIYPVPASDQIKIEYKEFKNAEIYDMNGAC